MIRRTFTGILVFGLALSIAGCRHNHAVNPIANVDSKQPDKVLFDRAMDSLKKGKYDASRLTLQTLINTYPDSEYIARAKLAIGDSWYEEGTPAALQQAEAEYKDFETFFPNLPEAAEAQMKVALIHYKQMEKPDRDFTNAKRAEDEYRQMIQLYPDSKLVPEAKQRLREVQEVLADREFRIGRFYYLRESWPAAIARLKSMTDTYPLYSQADQALMMLGDAYEKEVHAIKITKLPEASKAALIQQYMDGAAAAYDRIITRYPVMDRANEARSCLKEIGRPIPTPTPEAIAQNKSEQEGREELGRFGRMMLNLHKHPDMSAAARTGDPTLVDPAQTNAPAIIRNMITTAANPNGAGENGKVSIEKVGTGAPPPNEAAPRSDSSPAAAPAAANGSNSNSGNSTSPNDTGIQELKVNTPPATNNAAPAQQPAATKPASTADSPGTQTAPATQTGQPDPQSDSKAAASTTDNTKGNQAGSNSNSGSDSSSKKKKKKKLGIF